MTDPTLDEKIAAVRAAVSPDGEAPWRIAMDAVLADLEASRPTPGLDDTERAREALGCKTRCKAESGCYHGLDAGVAAALTAATRRAEAAEAGAHYGYRNEPCVICGESCSSLAGNPAQWPVRLGNDGWRHIGCVNKLLAEREAAEAEIGRLRSLIDDYIPTDCHPPPAGHTERARETAQQLFLEKGLPVVTAQGQTLRFLTVEAVGEALAAAECAGAAKTNAEWLDCAMVDVLMEGPALKSWNRSALGRLWKRALLLPGEE